MDKPKKLVVRLAREIELAPELPDGKPPRRRLSVSRVADALYKYRGNISAASASFEVTRGSLYSFIHDHPELKEVLLDSRQGMIDLAETNLYAAVGRGEPWAVKFTLKTIGKDRGYIEKQEVDHQGGVILNIVEEIVTAPEQVRRLPDPSSN